MGIAERIYDVVKGLPEAAAAEVLDYAQAKRVGTAADAAAAADAVRAERRRAALAHLDKHARKFRAVTFNRADLYDRAVLR